MALGLMLITGGQAAPLESVGLSPQQQLDQQSLLFGLGRAKKDRILTRWEMASGVVQLLEMEEKNQLDLAQRAVLRELLPNLLPELEGLAIRVTQTEELVRRLEQRLQHQPWQFYGSFTTRATAISLHNTGLSQANLVRGNATAPNSFLNFNQAVGSALGAGGAFPAGGLGLPNFNPFVVGVLTNTNWANGRPLVNGTGFTSRMLVGMKGPIAPVLLAGLELSAYSSQGNSILDAYYGVTAPYLNNPFTAATAASNRLDNFHQPNTSMNLERFWLLHLPTQTKLVLGSFSDTRFNGSIYSGLVNPNLYGPFFLDNYGAQIQGQSKLGEDINLEWEAMVTRLPDGNTGALPGTTGAGQSYWSHAEGVNLRLGFDENRGHLKINGLRASNDYSAGTASLGLLQTPNFTLNWVNPNGFYGQQLNFRGMEGIGSGSDPRPVVMNRFATGFQPDGTIASLGQVGPNFGGLGPQVQTSFGAAIDYRWKSSWEPRISLQWAHSHYKPQKTADYSVDGSALVMSAGCSLADKTLDLDLTYLRVDPTYDPFIVATPMVGRIGQVLWRPPDFNYYNFLYSLHDTREVPQNRTGLRAKLQWKPAGSTKVLMEYSNLLQTRTSLQGVRFSPGSLGIQTPNTAVLGQRPGTIEPVFGGYGAATFTSDGNNALARPLEDPTGKLQSYFVSVQQSWDQWTFTGSGRFFHISRPSQLSQILPGPFGARGEDVNHTELANLGWRIGLEYQFTPEFKARANYGGVEIYGHYDPAGTYSAYAETVGNGRFTNIDISQRWPEIGFNWQIDDKVSWSMDARYYSMLDHMDGKVFARPGSGALNINTAPNAALYSIHPFNWEGLQISTEFSVKF